MGSTNMRVEVDDREKLVRQVQRLRSQVKVLRTKLAAKEEGELPELPPVNARGNFPALETVRVILARKITTMRRHAGLSRAALAKRAGVRLESLVRIETGGGSPSPGIVDKIDRALQGAARKGKSA